MSIQLPSLFRQIREAQQRADKVWDPLIGLVVDNKDPKKLGRVKVAFPSLPGNKPATWAPIASMGAGEDRGWWFLPQKDDEVLVMFEHGDFERPVVIGALWNGVDLPPDKNDGENERRTLVSREGSRITFDDKLGTITLEDSGGFGKIEINATDNRITIEAIQGDVCIQSPKGEMSVVAKQIDIKATDAAVIHADGSIAIQSGGAASFKASSITADSDNIDFNESPPTPAKKAEAKCEEVPDPAP